MRLREEKERRKRENHERGILGVIEIKQRKHEIDQVMQQRHRQVQDKVNNKVMIIEEKYNTVEEERQARAAELKRENDMKIRMAKEKEELNRQAKLMKDVDRMKIIEEQVKNYKELRQKSENDRQHRVEEQELLRRAILEKARQHERELKEHNKETLETKLQQSEAPLQQHQKDIEYSLKKQKKYREQKLQMIQEMTRQTKEEKEQVKAMHSIEKENYDRMLAEKEKIQNAIKQMNMKMSAHKAQ